MRKAYIIAFILALIFIAIVVTIYIYPETFGFVKRENYNSMANSLQEQNAILQRNIENLNSFHDALTQNYEELQSSYDTLNKLYRPEDLLLRYPKDIPTSPSTSAADFLITNGGMLLKSEDLQLSSITDTSSMHPTISAGHTAILTTKFEPYSLQKGNIILYNSSYSNIDIMHRIIEVNSDNEICYKTQGDNNPSPDIECVTPSQIKGLVIGVIFDKTTQGYSHCKEEYVGVIINNELTCVPKDVKAGIYLYDQPISSATGYYLLCSKHDSSKPYTVITPQGTVLCYSYVE